MKKTLCLLTIAIASVGFNAHAQSSPAGMVGDDVLAQQRLNLAESSKGQGFGPQAPRNIDSKAGNNNRVFSTAPDYTEMNLCDIHFHKNAEHAGGQFSIYAGNGDGKGFHSGYIYSGDISAQEFRATERDICPSDNGSLFPGDTIEVHFVHSSAQGQPGPTLGTCLTDSIMNPQLRVEAQVFVLVNDSQALDFTEITKVSQQNGRYQAANIPSNTGTPVVYEGSTTGPGYNEVASPFQVTWAVRPNVAKVNIETVGDWCEGNVFNEDHAHGVRNLVINPDLLSEIE